MQTSKPRIFPMLIVGLLGAVIGSFAMMLYASGRFAGPATADRAPSVVSAAPIVPAYVSDQERIVNAVKRVSPSVVALNITVNGERYVPVDPFAQMFGMQSPGRVQRFRARASGSGWVFGRDGYIVTNAHVVVPARGQGQVTKIEVLFPNGDRIPGHVYAANVGADLALVKVDGYAKLPPPLEIGDSDKLQAGQWAIAIGEPFELQRTVTVGVVSGFNRDESIPNDAGGVQEFKGLLQTSAPINPGNSGGPLVDVEGRVIGVNQSTANPQAGAQGIGFAIPANTMRQVVENLVKNPGTHQGTNMGFIGASLAAVTPDLRVQLGYKGDGVAVLQVVSGSPADQAGLQPGDVITEVNGKNATSADDVIGVVKNSKPGQSVALSVWSGGVKKLVTVKVGERPADYPIGQPAPQETP